MTSVSDYPLFYFYFLSGEEELLIQEVRQDIYHRLARSNTLDRQYFVVEPGFDWENLYHHCQHDSLFSDKRLVDIYHPKSIDTQSTQALLHLSSLAHDSCIIIVRTHRLTQSQIQSSWYRTLGTRGRCLIIKSPQKRELPLWIQQRAKHYQLRLDEKACHILSEWTSGNLLAADQALQKCCLLNTTEITVSDIQQMMTDQAQFQLFELNDAFLWGKTKSTERILRLLREQGVEPILVLWSLSKEIRLLFHLCFEWKQGVSLQKILANQWASKRPLYQAALKRSSLPLLSQWLQTCQSIDLLLKTTTSIDPWQALSQLCHSLCWPGQQENI